MIRRNPRGARRGPDRSRRQLARLLGPGVPEVSCEECFEVLDRYVDVRLAGFDADATHPGMAAHLAGCPACREEHDSLLALAGGLPG